MNPHKFQEPTLRGIELLSRSRRLRRALLSAAGLPLLAAAGFWPGRLLAATEESPETEENWEGPFYKPGAPVRSVLLERDMGGTPLTVKGRVLDTRGRPLKGALFDISHADPTGTYHNQGFTLRGKLYTDDERRYTLRTIKPLGATARIASNAPPKSMSRPAPGSLPFLPLSSTSRANPGAAMIPPCGPRSLCPRGRRRTGSSQSSIS